MAAWVKKKGAERKKLNRGKLPQILGIGLICYSGIFWYIWHLLEYSGIYGIKWKEKFK